MQYPTIAQPQYGFGPTMPPGMYDTPPALMNFKDGGMTSSVQRVQNQGRGNDTMLVHMTPREVGGLQALARSQGGSLTINPQTGLPEAGFLDNFLPTLLGIGGTFLGIPPHLTAMAVGGIQTARTGNLGKGLLAGLGAYGGATMAGAMGAGAAPTSVVGDVSANLVNPGAVDPSLVANQYSIGAPAGTTSQGLNAAKLQATSQGIGSTFTGPTTAGFGPTADLYSVSAPATGAGITPSASTMANFGTPQAQPSFIDRFAQAAAGPGGTPSTFKTALAGTGVVTPFLQGPEYSVPGPKDEGSNYEGPYTPSERTVSYPDEERRRRSSEFMYFNPSNPVPFAEGGNVEDRSIKMPGADYVAGQSPEFNYNFQPVGIEGRNQFGMTPEQIGTYAMGEALSRINAGGIGSLMKRAGQQMKDSVNPYVDLSTYKYDPQTQRMVTGMASGGLTALKVGGLKEGAFIIPADVISHLGNGSSEAGMKIVRERLNARPIRGPGDGMSDSIPTTIAGRQKARVANEEAEVPPEVVASLGNGSMEKGAKKLFEMMDNVRKARTGKAKQAPEITADRHVPA